MSDKYKARIQGFIFQQTNEPKWRYDTYTNQLVPKNGLVTRQIQPEIKLGQPKNSMGLIGGIIEYDTTPLNPTIGFRHRNSTKDIHDLFKTTSYGNQFFSDIKSIPVPKPPRKLNKTQLSPVMINTNYTPTQTDFRILSKYFKKSNSKDLINSVEETSNSNRKTHYIGASSMYIGQEPSMKQKQKASQNFDVAKTEGMMDNLLIAVSRPTLDGNIHKIKQLIPITQREITHQDLTQGVLKFVNHFRSIKDQSHVLRKGEDIQRRIDRNGSLHSVASKTLYCRNIMNVTLKSLKSDPSEQKIFTKYKRQNAPKSIKKTIPFDTDRMIINRSEVHSKADLMSKNILKVSSSFYDQ